MTILPVKLSDDCPLCGEPVRVYQDYPSGRVIVRGFEDLLPHLCPGDDRGAEEIIEVTVCSVCSAVSDDELIGQVARTNWGRLIEFYHPGPGRPYDVHVCVPAAMVRRIARNPLPLRGAVDALKRHQAPHPVPVPRVEE